MVDPWDDIRTLNPGFGKKRFSKMELRDILIAVTVLSIAFFFILYYRGNFNFYNDNTMNALAAFGISVLLVVTSFMFHELAHKVVAQKYGAWAEFRIFPQGLLMALVFSFFGFLFAAPGAVYINGAIDGKRNGKISVAGPATNVVIAAIATVLWVTTTGRMSAVFELLAYINAFLALFNMLPIPPLDGSKIYRWNIFVYIGVIAAAAIIIAPHFIEIF